MAQHPLEHPAIPRQVEDDQPTGILYPPAPMGGRRGETVPVPDFADQPTIPARALGQAALRKPPAGLPPLDGR